MSNGPYEAGRHYDIPSRAEALGISQALTRKKKGPVATLATLAEAQAALVQSRLDADLEAGLEEARNLRGVWRDLQEELLGAAYVRPTEHTPNPLVKRVRAKTKRLTSLHGASKNKPAKPQPESQTRLRPEDQAEGAKVRKRGREESEDAFAARKARMALYAKAGPSFQPLAPSNEDVVPVATVDPLFGTYNRPSQSPLSSLVMGGTGRQDAERMSDPLQNPQFIKPWTEEQAPLPTKKALTAMTSAERDWWGAERTRRGNLVGHPKNPAEMILDMDDENRRAAWRMERQLDKRSRRTAHSSSPQVE